MNARKYVAALLADALPSAKVLDHDPGLSNVNGIVVLVVRTEVSPGMTSAFRANSVQVAIVTGHQDPARAEDALDEAVDTVLDALGADTETLTYTSAVRDVYENGEFQANMYSLAVAQQTPKD